MTAPTSELDALRALFADRYAIGRPLGRGGMGAVYLARDLQLDRQLAIKVLPPEFAAQADLRERFLRETRTAAGFSHPNIVPVFAVEDRGDVLAMAMGFVEGESLAERVARAGPLSVKETVRLLQDVGYALAYAHGRGVVHRDIKPDNIMMERATGRSLVMDFGISRTIAAPEGATRAGLTRVGEVVGTPEFMSPEQASGDRVDGRSDLYSLGLVAWFAVTGTLGISGENTHQVLVKQLTMTLPPIASVRGDLPPALAAAIDALLKKEPAQRFQSAEALVEAIDAAQLGAPPIPLPVRLFQQSGRTYLSNATLIALAATFLWFRADDSADLDKIVPASVAVALEWVLLVSIARQARNLRVQGFDHAALRHGLVAILEEGDEARAAALRVPGVARKRRIRLAMSPILFLIGLMNTRNAWHQRVETAPGHFSFSRMTAMLAISGTCAMVVGAVLAVIDPYRRPISQRLANAFWGGPIGRWMMWSSRDVPTGTTGASRVVAAPAAPAANRQSAAPAPPAIVPSTAPAPASGSPSRDAGLERIERRLDVLDRIEQRLDALERQRDTR